MHPISTHIEWSYQLSPFCTYQLSVFGTQNPHEKTQASLQESISSDNKGSSSATELDNTSIGNSFASHEASAFHHQPG